MMKMGNSWVLNNKQGFQDCEMYAKLEEWLGREVDEYWNTKYDNLELRKGSERYKPDHDWVQCNGCRKWRTLNAGFNSNTLPEEWFCNMPPFNGKCEVPEQQMGRGVIVIGEKRTGYDELKVAQPGVASEKEMMSDYPETQDEEDRKGAQGITVIVNKLRKSSGTSPAHKNNKDDLDILSSQTEDNVPHPPLKRLRRGPAKYKQWHNGKARLV